MATTTTARPRAWMIAGLVGLVVGGLALFYAPGQDIRYNGIATHQSLLSRVASRDVVGTVGILIRPYLYALPIVPWLVIALVARRRRETAPMTQATRRSLLALALGSVAIVVTLLASPKQGARLDFAAQLLVITAAAGWVVTELVSRWSLRLAAGLAAFVLAYAGWRCLATYHAIAPELAARLDGLEHAAPGSTLAFAPYSSVPLRADARGYERDVGSVIRTFVDTRWFIGDELLVPRWRKRLELMFRIAITLTGPDAGAAEVPELSRQGE